MKATLNGWTTGPAVIGIILALCSMLVVREVAPIDPARPGAFGKLQILRLLEYRRVLFLDSDVIVFSDVRLLWREFDKFTPRQAIGIADEENPFWSQAPVTRMGGISSNGGVVCPHFEFESTAARRKCPSRCQKQCQRWSPWKMRLSAVVHRSDPGLPQSFSQSNIGISQKGQINLEPNKRSKTPFCDFC